jgi:putative glycerol-1-phosphate prenyltransferase
MILEQITHLKGKKKAFAWLIDPDKYENESIIAQIELAIESGVDYIFVGGSLIHNHVDDLIGKVKSFSAIPVILFPGSILQLSSKADAILLLSLISGRNPEYLIGNHVIAAPFLRKSGLEIIPTGYMLVDGGQQTSVSYMSNTMPIPSDKPDIALATAMAGEMLGLKVIYMDAGSGAKNPVPLKMISLIASEVMVPVLVGGGIRTPSEVRSVYESGADLVIVGNAAESNHGLLKEMIRERDRFNI